MNAASITQILWANITRRLQLDGRPRIGINEVHRQTKVGRGTIQRIKEGGNVTLDSLQAVADALRVEPWQLLVKDAQAAPSAAEPSPIYRAETNSELVEAVGRLVQRVPDETRAAFADVLAGWVRSAGDESRQAALLALLNVQSKPQRAA